MIFFCAAEKNNDEHLSGGKSIYTPVRTSLWLWPKRTVVWLSFLNQI